MLAVKSADSNAKLLEIIQGVQQASGTAGTNTGASPNFQDLTADAFADVLVGDQIAISGEVVLFTVDTKTDDNNLILDQNIVAAHTTDGLWRAFRGGVGEANLKFGSPFPSAAGQNHWVVIFEATVFKV